MAKWGRGKSDTSREWIFLILWRRVLQRESASEILQQWSGYWERSQSAHIQRKQGTIRLWSMSLAGCLKGLYTHAWIYVLLTRFNELPRPLHSSFILQRSEGFRCAREGAQRTLFLTLIHTHSCLIKNELKSLNQLIYIELIRSVSIASALIHSFLHKINLIFCNDTRLQVIHLSLFLRWELKA